MQSILIFVLVFALGVPALATAGPNEDVAAATRAWAAAYDSRDPQRAIVLYDKDAVFWGTLSPTIRDTTEEILAYFNKMPQTPHSRVTLGEQRIRVYGDMAINTGYYTFNVLRNGNGSYSCPLQLRVSSAGRAMDDRGPPLLEKSGSGKGAQSRLIKRQSEV